MYVHYGEMHSFIFDHQEIKGIIKHVYHTVHYNKNTCSLIIYTQGWLPVYPHLCHAVAIVQ